MSVTLKTKCPHCGSDDCNETLDYLGELIKIRLAKRIIFCNHCTYTKVTVTIGTKEVFTETQLPGTDETEAVYAFHGSQRS